MTAETHGIRTPDQRLRVFVSSTLVELADERRAVRSAIESLRLAPVMFELGARPHPPRDLYRAYLRQSDVFLGIYGASYGWVAPEESISGLEDEYVLAPAALPKLIYLKQSETPREPRLVELIHRIRSDDSVSYKSFSTAQELADLVVGDLATLLAERFDLSRGTLSAPTAEPEGLHPAVLPPALTPLIGRAEEIDAVTALLRSELVRLVTITGPGGIGKSRLALAVGRRLEPEYPDGVVFVDLSAVRDPAPVVNVIAERLGVRDPGDAPVAQKLAVALTSRRILLLLDNVEQIPDLAPTLLELLAAAPGVDLLLTSRTLLRVLAERSYELGPLRYPDGPLRSTDDAASIPAVALFLERARAVKPDFALTADNLDAVVRVCAALEGVPLALELAAARIRILTPAAMLARLDRQLSFLVRGLRDLPDRQKTLRDTIQWSADLLTAEENRVLAVLGVFVGGFTLEAAAAVLEGRVEGEALDLLERLVDNSLVRQLDRGERSVFRMLVTVREYARDRLDADGLLEEVREAHAGYFTGLGERVELELEGERQRAILAELADERGDLRAAMRFLLDRGRRDDAAEFAWDLYLYWWLGGLLGEVSERMRELLDGSEPLSDHARAVALYYTRAIAFWSGPASVVVEGLTESATLFHRSGDPSGEALARVSLGLAHLAVATPEPAAAEDELEQSLMLFRFAGDEWGVGLALVTLGRFALLQGKVHAAQNRFEEGLEIATSRGDVLSETIARHHLGWARLLQADLPGAREQFLASAHGSAAVGHQEGVAYGLEGLVAVSAAISDIACAGRLLGAAERLREVTGTSNAAAFAFHGAAVAAIRAGPQAAEFDEAERMGRAMTAAEALEFALAQEGP